MVTTISGNETAISSLSWYRPPPSTATTSTTNKLDATFYCVADKAKTLNRFDTESGVLGACQFEPWPFGCWIVACWCVSSGLVLFLPSAGGTDDRQMKMYVRTYDPITCQVVERLQWLGARITCDARLDEAARTFVCGTYADVVTYTLPPQYFRVPHCCDRDL